MKAKIIEEKVKTIILFLFLAFSLGAQESSVAGLKSEKRDSASCARLLKSLDAKRDILMKEGQWEDWVSPRANQIATIVESCVNSRPIAVSDFIASEKTLYRHVSLPHLRIAYGNSFESQRVAWEGGTTLIYFTAPWCKMCKVIKPELLKLAEARPAVVLREADIIDWESQAHRVYIDEAHKFNDEGFKLPGLIVIEGGKIIYAGYAGGFQLSPEKENKNE